MGLFDDVNPDNLYSGANQVLKNLNDVAFNTWYNELITSKEWRDCHKSALVSTFENMGNYYSNARELLNVLLPMADLIQQFKEMEKQLEELYERASSATTNAEISAINSQIRSLRDRMNRILDQIRDYSNRTVDTEYDVSDDPNIYSDEGIIIHTTFTAASNNDYDRIYYNFNNNKNYYDGHSELGHASNSYVTKITRQITIIFNNMLELFENGRRRWKNFQESFSDLETNLDNTVDSFDGGTARHVVYDDFIKRMDDHSHTMETEHEHVDYNDKINQEEATDDAGLNDVAYEEKEKVEVAAGIAVNDTLKDQFVSAEPEKDAGTVTETRSAVNAVVQDNNIVDNTSNVKSETDVITGVVTTPDTDLSVKNGIASTTKLTSEFENNKEKVSDEIKVKPLDEYKMSNEDYSDSAVKNSEVGRIEAHDTVI